MTTTKGQNSEHPRSTKYKRSGPLQTVLDNLKADGASEQQLKDYERGWMALDNARRAAI